MALPLVLGAIAAGTGIAGGIAGKRAHNKYADKIEEQNVSIPQGIKESEGIYKALATQGIPKKDIIEDSIRQQSADTLSKAKEVARNPSDVLGVLMNSQNSADNQLRELGIQDANQETRNQQTLADFMARVKAPAQQRVEDFEINKALSAGKERMAGNQELWQGITDGVSSGVSTYGSASTFDTLQNTSVPKPWQGTGGGGQGGGMQFNPGPMGGDPTLQDNLMKYFYNQQQGMGGNSTPTGSFG